MEVQTGRGNGRAGVAGDLRDHHLRRGPSEWPLEELQLPGWAHMESICFTKDHLMPFIHYKIHKNNQNYLCVITGPKVVEPALHTQVFCPVFL